MAEHKDHELVCHTTVQQNRAGRIISIKINELEFLEGSVYSIGRHPDHGALSFRIRQIVCSRDSGYIVACEVVPRRRKEMYVAFDANELYNYYVH
jgi:hypothetical protein